MTRTFVVRVALTLWIALIGLVTVRVAVSKPTSQTVVPIYRAAGERWLAGESLYDPAPPHDTFRYPPGFAALFAPLSLVNEKAVAIVWRLSGAGLFLFGLWRFSKQTCPEQFPFMAALAAPLVLGSFNNGQVNLAIIGFVMLGCAEAGESRWTRSAIWFALAAGIKIYPISAGLLTCLLFPRTLAWRYLLATIAVFAIPFVLQNPSYVWRQHLELIEWVQKDDRLHTYALERVPRDWTVLTRTWTGWVPSAEVVRAVSLAAGLAFAVLIGFSRWKFGAKQTLPYVVMLSGIWMTLFGPATESVTYCLVAPGVVWFVATCRGWTLGLSVISYLLILSPVIRDIFPQSWKYSVYGPHAAGTILLLIATVMKMVRKDKEEVVVPFES